MVLLPHLSIHQLFAATTDVGKTIFATALVRASASSSSSGRKTYYLKPVSTGPPNEADYNHVQRFAGPHAAQRVNTACLYQLADPVSPHLAVQLAGGDVQEDKYSQAEFARRVSAHIAHVGSTCPPGSRLFVETAGGVHSPTLSALSQADAYRPFRLPTILIADARLGGISTTISAYESLVVRGYDVTAVLLFEDAYYRNEGFLKGWFEQNSVGLGMGGGRGVGEGGKRILVETVPKPPARASDEKEDASRMEAYYDSLCALPSSPSSSANPNPSSIHRVIAHLDAQHALRLANIASMPRRTLDSVWWPFVQHGPLLTADKTKGEEAITVIDSAYGDVFAAHGPGSPSPSPVVSTAPRALPTNSTAAVEGSTTPYSPPPASVSQTSSTSSTPSLTAAASSPLPPSGPHVSESPAVSVSASDVDRTPILTPQFDASASWWTQAFGHAHPQLTLAAAHAAGRYGHVIFPLATHEPALSLAERLLGVQHQSGPPVQDGENSSKLLNTANPSPGGGWASKVFFSDDGSTGTEVALKMAIRSSALRYPAPSASSTLTLGPANTANAKPKRELHVLGLAGSYHGDTIGAMDACEGGVYNSAVEWHRERGYWFDPPRVGVSDGLVRVSIPPSWGVGVSGSYFGADGSEPEGVISEEAEAETVQGNLQAVYDVSARLTADPLAELYRLHITGVLERLVIEEGRTFGALILEPILMGAGGMIWVDPLFQRVLIDVVRERDDLWSYHSPPPPLSSPSAEAKASLPAERHTEWRGLPVIFDEVFVGLYRLGFLSSSSLLGGITPDISVLAKILTGGLVPLSVTLASQSIFNSFIADEKKDALLHGHSYTAHPVGCAVAGKAMDLLEVMDKESPAWKEARGKWATATSASSSSGAAEVQSVAPGMPSVEGRASGIWSLWDPEFIASVSKAPEVDEVMCMGTVLAIQLRDAEAGYQASTSQPFLERVQRALGPRHSRVGSESEEEPMGMHFRPLGNVAYVMTSLNTPRSTIEALQEAVLHSLSVSASGAAE